MAFKEELALEIHKLGGWNVKCNVAVQDGDGSIVFMSVKGNARIEYDHDDYAEQWVYVAIDRRHEIFFDTIGIITPLGGHSTNILTEEEYESIIEKFNSKGKSNMSNDILNEEKITFIDMSDADKIAIISAKFNGMVELYDRDQWIVSINKSGIDFNQAYRIKSKPVKKLDIPWQLIDPKFKYAAMDKNSEVWLFEKAPEIKDYRWLTMPYNGTAVCASNVLTIDVTDIDWQKSVVERP